MAPRDWDAPVYERISAPIAAMGHDVLARLDLRGDETVLDAGCGTGRVAESLLERLPRGRVVAVDGSPAMIEQARERLAGDRVELIVSDLLDLSLDHPVDAVFSNATFHWIGDHDRLFERLHAALRPGGQLVAQCGGEGNIADTVAALDRVCAREPFAPAFAGWPGPWNYASPAATAGRLRSAGFHDVWTWRTEVRVDVADVHEYFATIMLGSHVERLPLDLRDPFVEAVTAEIPDPTHIDYVRLNILARA